MSLPVLHLSGTPYEQGLQHGKELKDRIAHNLDVYFKRFESEVKLTRDEVLSRAIAYRQAIESQNADYTAAMRGVADGSEFDIDEIAALNVRYEIIYYQYSIGIRNDGCTAFAVMPNASANGHLLMGQNWDWIPEVKGALLHTVDADAFETITFTEAGIVGGKIGLNSEGVGLAINGMTTSNDDWSRLSKPFHVRCYEILRQRKFDAAVGVVTESERSCSTNYMIAQAPDHVVDIEAAPGKVCQLNAQNGHLVHTNHFFDPEALGVVEPMQEYRPFSCHRLDRMNTLLEGNESVTIDDLKINLRDHDWQPYSICSHQDPEGPPERQTITVSSIIMDLHERTMHYTDGNPCENEYEMISLMS